MNWSPFVRISALLLPLSLSSCVGLYTSNISGFESQAAYALTNHLGVLGTFAYQPTVVDPFAQFGGQYFDLGVGYFDSLKNITHFETWATIGLGSANGAINAHSSPFFVGNNFFHSPDYNVPAAGFNRTVDCKYFGQSLQAHVGLEGDIGGAGIGVREVAIDMYHWHQVDVPDSGVAGSRTEQTDSRFGLFAEPYLFFRIGYKWVKLYAEYWYS
jgi:hypothetical protein